MALLSLAQPIENVANVEEARVLALANHLLPMLEGWRRGEDLRKSISQDEPLLAEQERQMASALWSLNELRTQRDAVVKTLASYGGASIAVVASGLILAYFTILPGLIVVAVGIFVGVVAAGKRHESILAQMAEAETKVAEINSSMEATAARVKSAQKELASRATGFPEVKMADVRFGLQMAKVAGRNVLLDASGNHVATVLKTVDVSVLQQGLSHISDKVELLLNVPPLLSPIQQGEIHDPVHQLFGEESALQDLVGEFTLSLGRIRDVNLSLPMVSPKSVLVRRLIDGEANKVDERPAITITTGNVAAGKIADFVHEVNQTRVSGARVFAEFNAVFKNLEAACALYANARTTSVNAIHQSLTEVLNRADWCSRRFYCPRTILSPAYIQELLKVDPDKAYLLSLDDLIERLRSDGEVSKRLDLKPELEQQLSDAYSTIYAVQDLVGDASFTGNWAQMDQRTLPKHVADQFRESVKRFTNILQQVMTGSSYPILNFSAEAQLYYDPDSDEWSSSVVPFRYSTPSVLKYGGVVKSYSDLLIPLWDHLWAEKSDFRKSELFRTNESMIRMTEKESEKLIEVANQFGADMRTIREHVNLIESDLKSKYVEIIGFRDGMDKLGLLSERTKAGISDEKLQNLVLGESMLSKSGRYEILLSTMPQSQAETRGTARDPIDLVREPDALVEYQANLGTRLLLS